MTMLALAATLSLGGATALAQGGGGDSPPPGGPHALHRPAVKLELSIQRFQREQRRLRRERRERLRKAAYVEGVPRSTLEAIASCESGGDPRAISSGGTYRGKYQFSYSTWASVGGEGDPARAGELEQDRRAALLYQRSGSAPWPVCG